MGGRVVCDHNVLEDQRCLKCEESAPSLHEKCNAVIEDLNGELEDYKRARQELLDERVRLEEEIRSADKAVRLLVRSFCG